jgi:hypothetical protein
MFRNDIFNLNNAYFTVVNEGTADLGPQAETDQQISPVQQTVLKSKHSEECECSNCAGASHEVHNGGEDVEMAKSELYNAVYHAISIYNLLKNKGDVEAWVSSKITKAADYLNSIKHYLDHEDGPMPTEENEEENLISALNLGSKDIINQISTMLRRESKENLQRLLYEVVKAIETKN